MQLDFNSLLLFYSKHLQVEIHTSEINMVSHVNFLCIYFHPKMVALLKHVVDNLNKIVKDY
jgi:hypothetical protein